MRTVDVLLRGFNDCEHAQFRSWHGVMNRACAQYMVYHGERLILCVRDPKFAYHTHRGPVFVRPYIHFCEYSLTESEIRIINAFLSGIGCVNRFKLVGKQIDIVGERKIEPKYPIAWITSVQQPGEPKTESVCEK